jgi:hypothetical protein
LSFIMCFCQRTEIGHVVSKLRKHPDNEVVEASKSLIRQWKRAVETSSSIVRSAGTSLKADKLPMVSIPKLADPVRNKSLRMIHDALMIIKNEETNNGITHCVYRYHRHVLSSTQMSSRLST